LRAYYEKKLEDFRRAAGNLVERYAVERLHEDSQAAYYATWVNAAVHMLTTIQAFQTIEALAERLKLPIDVVRHSLHTLRGLNLVRNDGGRWVPSQVAIHVPRDSPMNAVNHAQWRERAVLDALLGRRESVHYTAVYSLSVSDATYFQQLVIDFIDKTREVVAPSREEDVVCFNCDFFQI
jgi:hypothetical protein